MDNNVLTTAKGVDICTNIDTVSKNVENISNSNINNSNINNPNISGGIENAKELFNNCRYNDAEQIFSNIKGSDAAAWKILCYIVNGDIGRKGGKISTLLQESVKNQEASISNTIMLLKTLIVEYDSVIDRKTKNKIMTLLYDIFNGVMKEKMAITISDLNKRALHIVKEKGYTPSIYDDKTIPLQVLNRRLRKHKYRIRHYKPEEIVQALEIINDEKFVQEVINEYMSMAHSHITHIDKDRLDTRNPEILKYIRSLYISNIAYEKELRFTGSTDKLQFINNLNKMNERGWVRVTVLRTENTKYFNLANEEEKSLCETDIEKSSEASIVSSLIYEGVIEKRGYLIYDEIVNQISKEDIAIGDVTNRYTRQYIGPVQGTIYYDN